MTMTTMIIMLMIMSMVAMMMMLVMMMMVSKKPRGSQVRPLNLAVSCWVGASSSSFFWPWLWGSSFR